MLRKGKYKIVETWGETRILVLDDKEYYAWVVAPNIGEILVTTKKKPNNLYTLARGKFRLYRVKDESNLIGVEHLELYIGEGL